MSVAAWPRPLRTVLAFLAGIALNVILSLGVDEIFHLLGVYPPWDQPMTDTGDNLLALSYRIIFTVLAGVVTVRIAGYAPGWHAVGYAVVGTLLGVMGVIATTGPDSPDFGPDWYPVAIAASAIPCAALAWWIACRPKR